MHRVMLMSYSIETGFTVPEGEMKDGIERRKNGAIIRKSRTTGCYRVTRPDGTPSQNGPWDYLVNARRDADGEYPEPRK